MEVKEATLSPFLYQIKEKAKIRHEQRFLSFTKEIEPVQLLDVFDQYQDHPDNRYYWSNHQGDFSLLGIGIAKEFTSQDGKLNQVKKEWNQLLQASDEKNPYGLAGTGITALGGMAFDPDGTTDEKWNHFPPARFVIPAFMITFTVGRYFLTINHLIDHHTVIARVLDTVSNFEQQLHTNESITSNTGLRVLYKEEPETEAWKRIVQKAVEEIKKGHTKKIVLAREINVKLNKEAPIGSMLRRLINTQPNSYVFAYEAENDCFIGASPERLLLIEENELLSTCLAGTAPRGETKASDRALANELLQDEKNLEEHAYVVQMIKDSIGPFCEDIDLPENPVIYPLKNLQHLYTPVRATLKRDHHVLDLIERLHPTPALGGVPREKALAFIREEELMDRGWYGAPVGWMDSGRHSEFAVAIRSGLIQQDEVTLFAGCGVMRDSDPEMEFEETAIKFKPMLQVLEDHDESY